MNWSYLLLFITNIRLLSCEIIVPPIKGDFDWWQNSLIYEIFPLSFKDSDGDGLGDFKGITQKLNYLVSIGVTAIWLTPFLKSPLKSGGYDITDYQNVQNVFGTIEDLKDLLNSAHKKNLKVFMDFVPNHTSDEHVWFKSSVNGTNKYKDYYIWKNAKNQDDVIKNSSVIPIPPNNWKRILADGEENAAWIWENTRKQFYFIQFVPNLPDLNFRNKAVHKEMENILKYWLRLGIDGIRIDALKHVYESDAMKDEPVLDTTKPVNYLNMDHIYTADQTEVYDLIHEWHLILDKFKQSGNYTRIIMTESYSSVDILFKYYKCGAEIPSNFLLLSGDYRHTPNDFDGLIKNWIAKMPQGATYNVVLQNHDHPRFPTLYGKELVDSLNSLSLFLPGVAIVYYGGEIGMENIPDYINYARSPMQWDDTKYAGFTKNDTYGPWIGVHPDYVTRNVQTENNDPKSYLNFFKSVSKLRQTETLKRGGLATYIFNDSVYVLNRFLPGSENYTLVINMGSETQKIRLLDKIPNLDSFLTVVVGSRNSFIEPGYSISTEALTLSPGATIILTDKTLSKPTYYSDSDEN